jgi:hypothetical protein
MLKPGDLQEAFNIYREDASQCRSARAYWALLHLTVCLPDICSALEADDGEASGKKYEAWCNTFLHDPHLTGAERWAMRCKVLHQGRASLDQKAKRYDGFSFTRWSPLVASEHLKVRGKTLTVEVDALSQEMWTGINGWAQAREKQPRTHASINVSKHLPSLVRVRAVQVPLTGALATGQTGTPGFTTIYKSS